MAPVLRFETFPSCNAKAQVDVAGAQWSIIRIEAPYCWAARYGADADFVQHRIEVTKPRPVRAVPALASATDEQRQLYKKLRQCGIEPGDALRESVRAPACGTHQLSNPVPVT